MCCCYPSLVLSFSSRQHALTNPHNTRTIHASVHTHIQHTHTQYTDRGTRCSRTRRTRRRRSSFTDLDKTIFDLEDRTKTMRSHVDRLHISHYHLTSIQQLTPHTSILQAPVHMHNAAHRQTQTQTQTSFHKYSRYACERMGLYASIHPSLEVERYLCV